jgi:geranyl-CoA carboxylase alpha subunit
MGFSKILVANRGEIACRIFRTARAMGFSTVAVFSDADEGAPHVAQADQAVRIGEGPAAASYLRIDRLIEAARKTGADAVHPGYGFLSETAAFAQACADAGLTFVGPGAEAIRLMGDKARAKALMREVGVPVVPGAEASAAGAARTGFPLLVKAVAGGGGRGMRVVAQASQLEDAIASASREALSAFGDGAVMLEKFVAHGRHVEFQVFADAHGNVVHLGERDCTAQRRRQKVIEESPSPALDDALRVKMGEAAVKAARAAGYRNAGTVEFILDEDQNFYFLEMNTRLQVEHPVTEAVTGLNLVEWQFRVANGEELPLRQGDIVFRGHAIEARLCAENPYAGFAPQTGKVAYFRPERAGVRVDAGVDEGVAVSPFYDSMMAKFVAHGATREDAIRRLVAGLAAAPLLGVMNNARFLMDLLNSAAFAQARMHTGTIDGWTEEAILQAPVLPLGMVGLAGALFAGAGFWTRGGAAYTLRLETETGVIALRIEAGETVTVHYDGAAMATRVLKVDGVDVVFEQDGVRGRAVAVREGPALHLAAFGLTARFVEQAPAASVPVQDQSKILSPVAGTLIRIAEPGTALAAGDVVAVIEAMKIETRLLAPAAAIVARTYVAAGAQVAAKTLLVELEPA